MGNGNHAANQNRRRPMDINEHDRQRLIAILDDTYGQDTADCDKIASCLAILNGTDPTEDDE